MATWKTIKNIEKIQPEGVTECTLPKDLYYGTHFEDGTAEEGDFIAQHDEEDLAEDDEDYVPKTHEEVLEEWDEMLKEMKLKLGRQGENANVGRVSRRTEQ